MPFGGVKNPATGSASRAPRRSTSTANGRRSSSTTIPPRSDDRNQGLDTLFCIGDAENSADGQAPRLLSDDQPCVLRPQAAADSEAARASGHRPAADAGRIDPARQVQPPHRGRHREGRFYDLDLVLQRDRGRQPRRDGQDGVPDRARVHQRLSFDRSGHRGHLRRSLRAARHRDGRRLPEQDDRAHRGRRRDRQHRRERASRHHEARAHPFRHQRRRASSRARDGRGSELRLQYGLTGCRAGVDGRDRADQRADQQLRRRPRASTSHGRS